MPTLNYFIDIRVKLVAVQSNGGTGFQLKSYLINALKSNGFNGDADLAASAIAGHTNVESGNYAPDVIAGKRTGDGGKAKGLAQWHPDRWNKLLSWARDNGINPHTWQAQASYIVYEMKHGGEKRAWRLLEKANDVESAVAGFAAYERPSGYKRDDATGISHYDNRLEWTKIYATGGNKNAQNQMLAQGEPQPLTKAPVDPSTGMIRNPVANDRQPRFRMTNLEDSPSSTTNVSYSNTTGIATSCDHNGTQKPMNKQDEAWLFSMNLRARNNNNGFGNGELPNLLIR